MAKRARIGVFVGLAALIIAVVIDANPVLRIHTASLFVVDEWPLESGNRFNFDRARASFDYLAEIMRANPEYSAIYAGGKSLFKETCVHIDDVGCPASTDDELIRHIQKSGAFAVMNHGDTLLFGIGDSVKGQTTFSYGVARIEPNTDRFPNCRDTSPEETDFICVIPLDDVWHLQYSTYTDPDESP